MASAARRWRRRRGVLAAAAAVAVAAAALGGGWPPAAAAAAARAAAAEGVEAAPTGAAAAAAQAAASDAAAAAAAAAVPRAPGSDAGASGDGAAPGSGHPHAPTSAAGDARGGGGEPPARARRGRVDPAAAASDPDGAPPAAAVDAVADADAAAAAAAAAADAAADAAPPTADAADGEEEDDEVARNVEALREAIEAEGPADAPAGAPEGGEGPPDAAADAGVGAAAKAPALLPAARGGADGVVPDGADADGAAASVRDAVQVARELGYPAVLQLVVPPPRPGPSGAAAADGGAAAAAPAPTVVFQVEEGVDPDDAEAVAAPPPPGSVTDVEAPWLRLRGDALLVAVPPEVLGEANLASVMVTLGRRAFDAVHLDALLPGWSETAAAREAHAAEGDGDEGAVDPAAPGGGSGGGGGGDGGSGGSSDGGGGGELSNPPHLLREVDPVAVAIDDHVVRAEELWDGGLDYPGAVDAFQAAADLGSPGAATSLAAILLAGVGAPAGTGSAAAFASTPSFLVRRDLRRATALLVNATERTGHPDAHALLGLVYAAGLDVGPDVDEEAAAGPLTRVPRPALAVLHWSVAAASGHLLAQMALASRHLHGVDVPKSCAAAAKLYAAAARLVVTDYLPSWHVPPQAPLPKNLHVPEQVRLTEAGARSAASGGGSFRDRRSEEDEIVAYYTHTAAHGDEGALVHLGAMAQAGVRGVPLDEERAADLFARAAARGSAEGAARLGLLHLSQGKNESALSYLLEADAKGHSLGSLGVGWAYLHGLYQRKPMRFMGGDGGDGGDDAEATAAAEARWLDEQAVEHLKKAAENAQPDALYILGQLYRDGRGVKADSSESYRLLQAASTFHDLRAKYELGMILLRGDPPASPNCPGAVKMLKLVAEEGEWNDVLGMALGALEAGDVGGALYRYVQAAHAGIELAQFNAGLLYEMGFVVDEEERVGTRTAAPASPGPVAAAESAPAAPDVEEPSGSEASTAAATENAPPPAGDTADVEKASAPPPTTPATLSDVATVDMASTIAEAVTPPPVPAPGRGDVVDRAMRLYHMSALQGHADSLLRIGDLSYEARADFPAAAAAYQRAGKMGSAEAYFNLGLMYARGVGRERDFFLAKRYLDYARETSLEAALPATAAVWVLQQLSAAKAAATAVRGGIRRAAAVRDRFLRGWPAVGVPPAGGGRAGAAAATGGDALDGGPRVLAWENADLLLVGPLAALLAALVLERQRRILARQRRERDAEAGEAALRPGGAGGAAVRRGGGVLDVGLRRRAVT